MTEYLTASTAVAVADGANIDGSALACLLLQHTSSTFTSAAYDFGSFLFLIQAFGDTLIPVSLVGLASKLTGLLLSGYVGGLVDRIPRLKFVRSAIGVEKALHIANYALFLLLCGPLQPFAGKAIHFIGPTIYIVTIWSILILTVFIASTLDLASTAMTVAVERDWVTEIADGNSALLTRLNTYMRRIDLLSKLLAPLFVSLLTTFFGYTIASTSLLVLAIITCSTEYWWIKIVYNQFPILAKRGINVSGGETDLEERQGLLDVDQENSSSMVEDDEDVQQVNLRKGLRVWFEREKADWKEFARLPIFFSSISIAAIYLTTLSYDGTFIAYIKTARGWNDAFIAIMRAVCVVTGLIGTWVMPRLERKIGLERAGSWSIWFEVACLAPAALSFFYGAGAYGQHGKTWNSVVLFGGIALSRIGLWSFDLCQLKELQLALDTHPRRNQWTALQISLQNLFDLLKYVLTLSAATPIRFKWTALVSWIAVLVGAAAYAVYLKSVRGHLFHLPIWCMPKGG